MIVKLCLLILDGGHFSPSDVLSNDNARWQCIFSGLMRQVLYYDDGFNFDNSYVLCTYVYVLFDN